MEIWKPVKEWEGFYEISDLGRVKSLIRSHQKKEIIMAICDHLRGYKCVWFRGKGLHKKFFIHRLVAEAFIPNPKKKDIVNHIDHNKANNAIKNLEWVTLSENTNCYYQHKKAMATANDDMEF